MPPPATQQDADRRAEGDCSSAGSPQGAEYQPHWSFIAPTRPALPAVKNAAWVRNPIDRFVLAKLEEHGPDARARGRPPDAGPPAQPRPDRPAARRRRRSRRSSTTRRRTPTRSSSTGCWRRRTGASTAAATGSTPPATPTRTASTSTTTARSGRTATGSSTPSTRTCRSTSSRSSNSPATCCRTRRSTSRSPPASTAATSRPTRAASIAEEYLVLYTRDRTETDVAGLARPDGRLRRLPRPQVRPAHAEGVLRAGGVLQQHDAGRRWTATSRTRRRSSSCRRPDDRAALGRRWPKTSPRRSKAVDDRASDGREPSSTSGSRRATADDVAGELPTTSSISTRRSTKARQASSLRLARPASATLRPPTADWRAGHVAGQGLQASRARRRGARRRRLRAGPAVLLRRLGQARRANDGRRDRSPAWTTSDDYRGWDLWLENGRVGTHIINKWPDDALKVVANDALKPGDSGRTCSSPTTAPARPRA